MSYDAEMLRDVMAYNVGKSVNFFPQIGWTNAELNNLPNFAKIQYAWFGTHVNAIAKAIVGSPGDFEANYAGYQKVFRDNDWDLGMYEYQLKWKESSTTRSRSTGSSGPHRVRTHQGRGPSPCPSLSLGSLLPSPGREMP